MQIDCINAYQTARDPQARPYLTSVEWDHLRAAARSITQSPAPDRWTERRLILFLSEHFDALKSFNTLINGGSNK